MTYNIQNNSKIQRNILSSEILEINKELILKMLNVISVLDVSAPVTTPISEVTRITYLVCFRRRGYRLLGANWKQLLR